MARIIDPRLEIAAVAGHEGRRQVIVRYGLDVQQSDALLGTVVTERVDVRARDEHDAPVRPRTIDVWHERSFRVDAPGTGSHVVAFDVPRAELDAEQDWWRTGQGGEIEPIAEFVDHLVAEVALLVGSDVVATATTPVVSGSWGALGHD